MVKIDPTTPHTHTPLYPPYVPYTANAMPAAKEQQRSAGTATAPRVSGNAARSKPPVACAHV